jgi:DNA (cytosine-5)-methyltransferase 1
VEMSETLNMFDMVPEADAGYKRPIKSTDWKWSFKDYPPKNGLKVFSCFACGGGSTMGYKLAGCEVLGCVEIDKAMYDLYVTNHHPRFPYNMDIRDFNKIPDDQLPPELFALDILDGSPPCTTFSMAGQREESWGKKKKFREGQKEQTLDDISFVFIETAKKLKPRVVVMENVEGLLLGEAFDYVRRIYADFKDAGYRVWHWLLKGENMGVPQTRHRTFFVAIRTDLGLNPMDLDMVFNYESVLYGAFKSTHEKVAKGKMSAAIKQARPHEKVEDVMRRLYGIKSGLTHRIARENEVFPTQVAAHSDIWTQSGNHPSLEDVLHATSFPEDYNLLKLQPEYICGMSVPPVMMKRVVTRLIEQGVFDYKPKGETT